MSAADMRGTKMRHAGVSAPVPAATAAAPVTATASSMAAAASAAFTAAATTSAAALAAGERQIRRANRDRHRADGGRKRQNDKPGGELVADRSHAISFP
jgi:hypothetical protein